MRRLGRVALRVRVERRLVSPQLEGHQRVGVQGTLKHLELLTAGLLLHSAAAVGHGLGQLRAFPRFRVRRNDETNGHVFFLSCRGDRDGFTRCSPWPQSRYVRMRAEPAA